MTTPPTPRTPSSHPDLLALLRAELDNAEVLAAAEHLDGCGACRHELALTATGHSLITSSARTLGPLGVAGEPQMPPLPDLVGRSRRRRRTRITWGVAAATVAAAVWTGGFVVGGATGDRAEVAVPTPSATPTGRTVSVALRPVEGTARGTVSMTDDGTAALMRIEADDLPAARDGQFYYAWLLDPLTNKMLPLGQVGPGGTASFEVTPALLAAYSAVDVSLETDDGDPGHSPRSVLRAVYA